MIQVKEETVSGPGGALFVRSWQEARPPRATLLICHGFNSHSGYYGWLGEQSAARGYMTYALDLRGRGKSAGERFYVESFADYVADLRVAVTLALSRHPSLPVFLLGHSAGAVVGCLYALEYGAELAGFVCEAPAFEVPAPDFALALLKGISHVAPHAHSLELQNADFSRDPNVVSNMDADPLISDESQPFATMAALVRADERLRREIPRITTPLLVLHGTADKAAKPSGSQHLYDRAGAVDKTLKLYEGGYHDLLNDLGKQEVLKDVLAWLDERR
jgi:acylglycerol lipase